MNEEKTSKQMDNSKRPITPSVNAILEEVKIWENKLLSPNLLKKTGKIVGKPIEWIFNLMPTKIENVVVKSIEGLFGSLLFLSKFTYKNPTRITKSETDIQILKKNAAKYITENSIAASLQGFGCGIGGIALIAVDIPLIFGIAFRVIQQIGTAFNYDMDSPEEKKFIMQIIDLGSCIPTVGKLESMLGKESLKNYVKKTTFKHMEKIAATKLGKKSTEEIAKEILHSQGKRATKKAIEKMVNTITKDVSKSGTKAVVITSARKTAKDVGKRLTRKKLLQLIPLVGGFIGAGFNYWFVKSVAESAYYAYLKRYIYDNYEV